MKTSILFTFLFFIMASVVSAQTNTTGKIWVTIDNPSILVTNSENTLASNDASVQTIIDDYAIFHVEQALPDSRKSALRKVYELHCDCDGQDLIAEIINSGNENLIDPELAPEYELLSSPNDYTTSFTTDYALDLIDAQGAWDYTTGDTNIFLGISDGNYYLNHEDLVSEYTTAGSWTSSTFYYHHGTAVAITAAGATDNGVGKSSIGYDCRLHLRAMNYNDVLQLTYAGANVINLSWMSGCWYSNYVQMVIDEVYNNGTIVVAAAGNGNASCGSSSNLVYPAACNNVIAVTSVGPTDNHEGVIGVPSSAHQHNSSVDICAPGYNVPLSIAPGNYLTGNGTSFAAPYVTGTIGLMLSLNPCLTFEEIEQILYTTAVDIYAQNPNYIGGLGAGRLDAKAALQMVMNTKVNAVENNVSCNGFSDGAISLENTSLTDSFSWTTLNGSGITQGSMNQNGLTAGTYEVTVTDTNGCSISESIVIIEPSAWVDTTQLTTYSGGQHISCNGGQDGMIDLEIFNGTGVYTYLWSSQNGTGLVANSEDQINLSAGVYEVEVTDIDGCVYQEIFTLTEPQSISLSLSAPTFPGGDHISCHGLSDGSIDMQVSGGTSPYTFLWSTSNGSGLNPTGQNQSGLSTGEYVLLINDANGCSEYMSLTLNEPTELQMNASVTSNYAGTAVSCEGAADGSAMASVSGGVPGYSIQWNTAPVLYGESVAGIETGTYTVICTDTNGCIAEAVIELDAHDLPELNPGEAIQVCQGETIELVSGVDGSSDCQWFLSNGMELNECGNNTIIIEEDECLDATLYAINEFGCADSVFLNEYICVRRNPLAEFTPNKADLTIIDNTVSFSNTSLYADSYSWNFGDGGVSYEEEPNYSYEGEEIGIYKVVLYAENDFGCWDSTSRLIEVHNEMLFYLPNSFTPNGDEHNNVFKPIITTGVSVRDYSLTIYDRWGQLVFESLDSNFGWDGTFDGAIASSGTYVWVLLINADEDVLNGTSQIINGHVNLIR